MDTKLTLKLDKEVIELAKTYVKKRGTSLSKFIEDILRTHVKNEVDLKYEDLHPDLKELKKLISNDPYVEIDENFDYKKSKAKYLIKKYGE